MTTSPQPHADTLDSIPPYQQPAPLTPWQRRKRWLREELGTFVGVMVILLTAAAIVTTAGGFWPSFGHEVAKVLHSHGSTTKVATRVAQRATTISVPPGTSRPSFAAVVVSPRAPRSPAPSSAVPSTPRPTTVRPTQSVPPTVRPTPTTPSPAPTPTTPSPTPTPIMPSPTPTPTTPSPTAPATVVPTTP